MNGNGYNANTLPLRGKIGYALGEMPTAIGYNIFQTYFLFFLTDIAGIPSLYGGLITSVLVIWDGVSNMIIGYLSDNSKNTNGRRRPYMIVGLIPFTITLILLFVAFDISNTALVAYFMIVGLVYSASYNLYLTPFYALGAEITTDYDDRNTLRSICGYVIYIGVWVATSWPMYIGEFAMKAGASEESSWTIAVVIMSLLGLITGFISIMSVKGKESRDAEDETETQENILVNYLELLKNRAVKSMVIITVFYGVMISLAASAFVYLMDYTMQLSGAMQGTYWTIYSISTFVMIPIANIIANKAGKVKCLIIINTLSVIGCIFFAFFGIPTFLYLVIFSTLYNFADAAYWTIGYSVIYDLSEVDEIVSGKRREGAVIGLVTLAQKIGQSLGLVLIGVILGLIGYNDKTAVYSEHIADGILKLNTLGPGIFLIIISLMFIRYPVTRETFAKIQDGLRLRKEGKEIPVEGLEKILPKKVVKEKRFK